MKTLNATQRKILELVPEERADKLADMLYKQIRSMAGGHEISFRNNWSLVIAYKAGFALALQKAAELVDSTSAIPKAASFRPGEPPLKDGVISSRGFGSLRDPVVEALSIGINTLIKRGNFVVLLDRARASVMAESQWGQALKLWMDTGKIDTIKFIRESTGYGIKESKELAEEAFKGIPSA